MGTWSPPTRRAERPIPSTSCSTPGSSTITGISTWSSSTRRPHLTTCSCRSPSTTADQTTPRCTYCQRCGSGTRGRGRAAGSGPPCPHAVAGRGDSSAVRVSDDELGTRWLYADQGVPVLVTGNETNNERVFGSANDEPYVKDGIDRAVVGGDASAVDPSGTGTKAAMHYAMTVPAGGSATLRLRLTPAEYPAPDHASTAPGPFSDFDLVMSARRGEADEFWADLLSGIGDGERLVARQAMSGMLWSKQYYALDVERWLTEHGADPLDAGDWLRNHEWRHLLSEDIISMPDTWEYPWFAAWDLAFPRRGPGPRGHGPFAKQQIGLLLTHRYLHPNGQLPALRVELQRRQPARACLGHTLHLRARQAQDGHRRPRVPGVGLPCPDAELRLVAQPQGRGQPEHLPGRLPRPGQHRRLRPQRSPAQRGGRIDQADGTAWMALYCQNMMQIALELSRENPALSGRTPRRCWRTSPGSPPPPATWGRTGSASGTRRTASSTTCCGIPTAAQARSRCDPSWA